MHNYLSESTFKKYLEDTTLYLVSSEYFLKVSYTTLKVSSGCSIVCRPMDVTNDIKSRVLWWNRD